jgi:hypothetical protein
VRTVKVDFQVPIGEGLAQMTGIGPKVNVSTEVILSDETEEAAQQAGVEAYQTLSAFVNGWASAQ